MQSPNFCFVVMPRGTMTLSSPFSTLPFSQASAVVPSEQDDRAGRRSRALGRAAAFDARQRGRVAADNRRDLALAELTAGVFPVELATRPASDVTVNLRSVMPSPPVAGQAAGQGRIMNLPSPSATT